MKKIIALALITGLFNSVDAQDNRTTTLENLERNTSVSGNKSLPGDIQSAFKATIQSATRLFADKDDLTSVITIIPSGSEVDLLGADSTYLRVVFEEAEGFILKRHAVVTQTPFSSRTYTRPYESAGQTKSQSQPRSQTQSQPQPQPQSQPQSQSQPQQGSRFTYLENKYGTSMASRLIAGKIWKGMPSDMVLDSWGKPLKTNRVISGNTIKEEWIYKNTWLYIEDDILMTWGPLKK